MNANEIANAGIVTQLAVVHTMLPKVKELIDQQVAEIESLKAKQDEVLREVKTSWTAISPVGGITRESAHKLYEVLKEIMNERK